MGHVVTDSGVTLDTRAASKPALKRALSLSHATLYGLGVTIGAGIYVLIGAAASRAGMYAPLAFIGAAMLMGLSGASFAELAGRLPVAAGEAAYVRKAFELAPACHCCWPARRGHRHRLRRSHQHRQRRLSGRVHRRPAASACDRDRAGHGPRCRVGVRESVSFAAAMTLIEVAGLAVLIAAGFASDAPICHTSSGDRSARRPAIVAGLVGTVLLAVFAFIGFEGLADIAEEVREPERTLPRSDLSSRLLITTAALCDSSFGSHWCP